MDRTTLNAQASAVATFAAVARDALLYDSGPINSDTVALFDSLALAAGQLAAVVTAAAAPDPDPAPGP